MAVNLNDIKTAYKLFKEHRNTAEHIDLQTEAMVEYPASILVETEVAERN